MNIKDVFCFVLKLIDLGGWLKFYIKALTKRKLFSVVKKNCELIGQKKSDVCYICALGPSLKQVDLSKIDGDTIVVNRFYKIGRSYPTFTPTYYLMIDALFKNKENRSDFVECINQYKDKDTIYLLNSVLSYEKELIGEELPNIYFLSCFKGVFNHTKKLFINKVMPAFGNVACTAIAVAMSLGYNKIVLLGCDFNSFASATRNHCYAEDSTTRLHKMSYELFCYSFVADMHDELQRYATEHDIRIVNSTKGSLIDAYPVEIISDLYK